MMENYRRAWVSTKPIQDTPTYHPSVSILVAARNEAGRIRPTLDALRSLIYAGSLEIIFIDDHSDDGTAAILHDTHPGHFLILKNEGHGKRAALQTGLQSAAGEIILLTDADCLPDPNWVTAMTAPFADQKTHWISGSVVACPADNLVSRYDALEWQGLLVLTGSGFALDNPVLAQGANIAFRQISFEQIARKATLPNRASGDDVFLLAEFLRCYPEGCKFQSDPLALVRTLAAGSWAQFIAQRLRWTSKSRHLHPIYGLAPMALTFVISFLFLVIPVFWIKTTDSLRYLWFLPIGCKLVADYRLLSSGWKMTGDIPDMKTYMLSVFIHPAVVVFTGLVGPLRSRYLWKGRQVR